MQSFYLYKNDFNNFNLMTEYIKPKEKNGCVTVILCFIGACFIGGAISTIIQEE